MFDKTRNKGQKVRVHSDNAKINAKENNKILKNQDLKKAEI